jgi:hypothetical protein
MRTCYWCDAPATAAFMHAMTEHSACEKHRRIYGAGSTQRDLFLPMCGESLAVQEALFPLPGAHPCAPERTARPDLPGQMTFV